MTTSSQDTTNPTTKLEWALKHLNGGWTILPLWWVRKDGRLACGKSPGACKIGKHPLWIKDMAEHGASWRTVEAWLRR